MYKLEVEAKVESVNDVTAFVDEILEKYDCPIKPQTQIDVAIDELFGNIARYAYPDSTGKVEVLADYEEATSSISITFIDDGIPYNPMEKSDPDVTLSVEERGIGGLGIFIAKKTMDEMNYEYVNNKNKLTIIKKIF